MPHLIIEYTLEGRHPGYAFTPPTDAFDEALLKAVWRGAMPRGQGWGADTYAGARSLKCFQVDKRIMAISEIAVTGQVDEQGRRGIRRAEITLIPVWQYDEFLRGRLDEINGAAKKTLNLAHWLRVVERALPKLDRKRGQMVVAYPYSGPEAWRLVEALVLTLATAWPVRLFRGKRQSLTTLALTHRDESQIVALPHEKAHSIRDVPVIDLL